MEILIPNAAIRNLIREDKVHQIYSMMQTGQEKYGMQTFNQALATSYFQRQVTLEMAMQRSHNQDELQELINRGSGLTYAGGPGAQGGPGGPGPRPGMPGQRPGMPPMGRTPGR
jgi:twitching motility protein PilT